MGNNLTGGFGGGFSSSVEDPEFDEVVSLIKADVRWARLLRESRCLRLVCMYIVHHSDGIHMILPYSIVVVFCSDNLYTSLIL